MSESNKKFNFKQFSQHPAIRKPIKAYSQNEYTTFVFVIRETFSGFNRHNIMGLSASLSFYALFALIPLILLIFYLLSHLVFSSDYAIVKLAILTSNLVPDFSSNIMMEVYKASTSKAAWGAVGLFILFWTITPLARAMRTSFYDISSMTEPPSFLKGKMKDVLAVLGILLLFCAFTAAGFIVEQTIKILAIYLPSKLMGYIGNGISLLIITILIMVFYHLFFPMRVAIKHIAIGAFITAGLWLLMRPAFSIFLSLNQNYGAVFGGMKNMFVSITWLYMNFAVFLFGSVVVATLRKQDVLLLRGLFDDMPDKQNYIATLLKRYGKSFKQHDFVFEIGNNDRNLYYLVDGTIHLTMHGKVTRKIQVGQYFGETAILTEQPTTTNALVMSESADVIVIYAENIQAMLSDYPKVAMRLLKQIASRIDHN